MRNNLSRAPVDQGSSLHMAIKLLKAENSNLEKTIILLKTENTNLQRRMKELEYQNDRFRVTQEQLKADLRREKEMVRYLYGLTKKYERTLQRKDAEAKQKKSQSLSCSALSDPESNLASPRRPAPPKRSDSFKLNRELKNDFVAKNKEKLASHSPAIRQNPVKSVAVKKTNSVEEITCEWEDVTDVLGYLNEKVNQFEKLLLDTSGNPKGKDASGYSSSDTMASM